MSFVLWLKYKVLVGTLKAVALIGIISMAYSFFIFEGLSRMLAVAGGIIVTILSFAGSHYYKVKRENLFFLPEKIKKARGEKV
jgi:hypothetical protein